MLIRSVWNWMNGRDLQTYKFVPPKLTWRSYVVAAVLTYGYAYNAHPYINSADEGVTAITSFGAAVAWPLFWSAELFSWLM